MATGLTDADRKKEQVLISLMRETPVWRRWQLAGQLTLAMREVAMSGLQRRYPDASPEELRRRLAGILLGEEAAEKAYGPLPKPPHA